MVFLIPLRFDAMSKVALISYCSRAGREGMDTR
jgi:hypothetical protein